MMALMMVLAFASGVQVVAYERVGDIVWLAGAVGTGLLCLVVTLAWASREAGR